MRLYAEIGNGRISTPCHPTVASLAFETRGCRMIYGRTYYVGQQLHTAIVCTHHTIASIQYIYMYINDYRSDMRYLLN